MSDWAAGDLDQVAAAEELQISSSRTDGSARPYVTIWVVRVGHDLYVRSYRGRNGAWFHSALRRPEGHIRAGGVDRDVTFEPADDADQDAIDQAYRSKYGRYSYVGSMVSPDVRPTTLRLVPR